MTDSGDERSLPLEQLPKYRAVRNVRELLDTEWPALITLTFAERDGGTRLAFHLVGPADMVTDASGIEEGWNECLDSLERFLASRVKRR